MEDKIKNPAPVDTDEEEVIAPTEEVEGDAQPTDEAAEDETVEIKPVRPPMADDVPGEGAPMGGEEKIAA